MNRSSKWTMNLAISLILGLTSLGLSAAARGADFPTKAITMLCGSTAGSPVDVMARELARQMEKIISKPVVVQNKPGGSQAEELSTLLGQPADGSPADEETPSALAGMIGHYKRSKFLAEEAARDLARRGAPVVIVNPAAPVGIGDHKPTPTGRMIVDFLNGRMPAYVDTCLTLVDVDDAAAGHLLAAEKGRVGERYILGGEVLSLKGMLDILSDVSGLPSVRWRIPHALALAWGYLDVSLAAIDRRRVPVATPTSARLSRRRESFSSAKAVRELGFPQTPAREALRKAVEWYRANGYAPRRTQKEEHR